MLLDTSYVPQVPKDIIDLLTRNFPITHLLATGLNTSVLTGVIWNNTFCPDSTNSDNNGNTCVGHLTP